MEKKLPKEFKRKWLKALRGGRYKQGSFGVLLHQDDNEYCCIGVACRVAGIDKKHLVNVGLVSEIHYEGARGENSYTEIKSLKKLPAILHGDGIRDKEAGYKYNPVVKKLANMNDSGKTFTEIADWIKTNL